MKERKKEYKNRPLSSKARGKSSFHLPRRQSAISDLVLISIYVLSTTTCILSPRIDPRTEEILIFILMLTFLPTTTT